MRRGRRKERKERSKNRRPAEKKATVGESARLDSLGGSFCIQWRIPHHLSSVKKKVAKLLRNQTGHKEGEGKQTRTHRPLIEKHDNSLITDGEHAFLTRSR